MEVSGRRTGPFEDISSAEEGELFCQPCSSDDDWVVAKGYCQNCNEYFCTACLKFHRKQSATKHHVILEGENIPNLTSMRVGTSSLTEICLKHSNEILKFYCPSHDTLGCSDCMVLGHKPCKVERIQDISRDYYKGHEHKQLLGTIHGLLQNIDYVRSSKEVAAKDVNESYTQAVADIKAFRKEINEYLDRIQAEILTEVNKRKQNNEMTISHITAKHQSLRKEIEMFDEKLQQQSSKASALFVAAKQMKARLTSFESTINNLDTDSKIKQYKFEPSSDIKHVLSSHGPLGKLTENIKHRSSHKKLADMEVQFDGEINIKTTEDTRDCFIVSSALISPSHIVLADNCNNCLKIVDVELRKRFTRYILTSEPVDVAVVSKDIIAVTLPNEQKILFLTITKQITLTESHDLKVNGAVRKIACQNDNLIIGYEDKIEILTMTGKVVKTISFANLSRIESIAAAPDSKTFYVAHSKRAGKPTAIYKFDFDGNQLGSNKEETLSYLGGLTETPDGTVLACSWSNNGSIRLISPGCKKIKEILLNKEHVRNPQCLSFCCETNELFLCTYPTYQNVLFFFQLK